MRTLFGYLKSFELSPLQVYAALSLAVSSVALSGTYCVTTEESQNNFMTIAKLCSLQCLLVLILALTLREKKPIHHFTQSNDFATSLQPLLDTNIPCALFTDLDDTILMTSGYNPNLPAERKSGYGSDTWFVDILKTLDKHTPHYPALFMLFLSEYFLIQHHAQHITTEPCVPAIIDALHQKNNVVLGITARSIPIMDVTLQRVRELGIKFSDLGHKDIMFELNIPIKVGQLKPTYKNGIIFCCGHPKEQCIDAFFKTKLGASVFKKAAVIAFIDDKEGYCTSIDGYLRKNKKSSHVVHYTHVANKLPIANKETVEADRARLSETLQYGLRF